jgi:uncharacterized membrane protein
VLACGPGFPTFQGRDAPEAMISARGDTVVFNRCVPAGGTCSTNSDVVRWTTATGSTRLGSAWAYAASADGATILADTGNGSTGSSHPVIWRDGSFADLNLAGAFARLLSADGAVVAARVETSVGVTQVVLRSVAGTTTMLGDLPGGPEYSEPNAINVDGTVVAGYGNTTGGQEPFVWTAAAGQMVNLGSITTVNQTVARAVSSDGTAAAGTSLTGSGTGIFHWTAAGGMKGIGYRFDNVPGPSPFFFLWSPPILISSDGTIVAGTDTNPTDPRLPRAFRWNSVAGSVALTPSTDASILRAASQDGRRLLGARVKSSAPPGMPAPLPGAQISFTPFVWDATGGTQDLAAVLGAAGIDLGGLTLGDPIAISADGTNVVGHAACGADTVIYRVTLPL